MKKLVEIDERASQEIQAFSDEVQAKFFALFKVLEQEGFLKEPFAKKINEELFEVRVKHKGQWRALYIYLGKQKIIVVSAFAKKTQKTPKQEINKAMRRCGEYL